jgi:hypothetical protein
MIHIGNLINTCLERTAFTYLSWDPDRVDCEPRAVAAATVPILVPAADPVVSGAPSAADHYPGIFLR